MNILLAGCTTDLGGLLNSKIKERLHAMISLHGSARNLTREMEHLRCYRKDKENEVKNLEKQNYQMKRTETVVDWLKSVDDLGDKVNEFELYLNGPQAGAGEASSSSAGAADRGGCMLQRWGIRMGIVIKLSGEVADLIGEVRDLRKEGDGIKKLVNEAAEAATETCDIQMVGEDANQALDAIHGHLADDKVGIIGIYGMGGVGKSTLLKRIKHEYTYSTQEFSRVLWAEVTRQVDLDELSEDPSKKAVDIERLRNGIGKDLPRSSSGWTAESLKEALRASGRFLLLLENVWDKLDLEMIGIPNPDVYNRCKIIFTTRSDGVRKDMNAAGVKLSRLTDEEAFKLFKQHLNNDLLLDTCQNAANIIVRECHGLPLALIVMARVMRNKNFAGDWFDTVDVLQDPRTKFDDGVLGEGSVFKVLRYSYWHLKDEWRPCLVYCSLFHNSSTGIDREELIDYWIGEGFFDSDGSVPDIKVARRKGRDIINQLVSTCLLERSSTEDDKVKMHGLIHDMAIKIANNEMLVYPDSMTKGEQKGENWEVVKRISLSGSKISKLPIKKCPNLVTLLLKNCEGLSDIPDKFFDRIPALCVLDLSNTLVEELPRGISNLKQLRHLNLSRTRIKSLPVEVSALTRLIQLDMSYTRELKEIPSEAISGHEELRTLNMFRSNYRSWVWDASNPQRGVSLSDLEGLLKLRELSLNISEHSNFVDLLESEISQLIVRLHLEGFQGITPETRFDVLENLREFYISNIMDLDTLVLKRKWLLNLEAVRFSSLSVSSVSICEETRTFPVCRLTRVEISRCNNLKDLSWAKFVDSMQILSVDRCKKLKVVLAGGDGDQGAEKPRFNALKSITLTGLPKLERFSDCNMEISCVPSITVEDCPLLTGDFVYSDKDGKQVKISYQNCRKAKQVVTGD
ncbi:hypothetical protein Taro_028202 [Colocasia esculenta]|uniref:NB-ARC domain-containing protein n=1 Tax=Colocasia esculenta TaxID=4460 RepID=A0A843VR43_COLES|nr:hypothetical protein [Colocasia esculenta]